MPIHPTMFMPKYSNISVTRTDICKENACIINLYIHYNNNLEILGKGPVFMMYA